jgi:APA family basic amino acid/polyamine antiporter
MSAVAFTVPSLPRTPPAGGYPVTPVLSIACCVRLMAGLELSNWTRLGGWLVVGLVIYFPYGRRRSRLAHARG